MGFSGSSVSFQPHSHVGFRCCAGVVFVSRSLKPFKVHQGLCFLSRMAITSACCAWLWMRRQCRADSGLSVHTGLYVSESDSPRLIAQPTTISPRPLQLISRICPRNPSLGKIKSVPFPRANVSPKTTGQNPLFLSSAVPLSIRRSSSRGRAVRSIKPRVKATSRPDIMPETVPSVISFAQHIVLTCPLHSRESG